MEPWALPDRGPRRCRRVLPVISLTVVAAVATVATACSPDPTARDGTTSTSGAAPPALTASIYQTRMDVGVRQIEVRLTNTSETDVTVEHLSLVSTAFDEPMTYPRTGSVIGAGRVVDMPVELSDPVCGGAPGRHVVRLDYRHADGRTGAVEIPATDEGGRVADLHDAECFAEEMAQVATLAVEEPPVERLLDGHLVADVTLALTPGDGEGELVVRRVGGTTLLQPVDPLTGEHLPQGHAVDRATDEALTELTVTVVPGRCDAHAVAEDKQGTRFPVEVTLDGRDGRVVVASPPAVSAALYAFVRRACEQG